MKHDWSGPVCLRCGIADVEWSGQEFEWSPLENECTGNAYICRVARKIYAIRGSEGDYLNPNWLRPWELGPVDFKLLVKMAVQLFVPMFSGNGVTETAFALMESIPKNPGVCPVLADALEEAGCEDQALLEALRTP